MTVDNYVGYFVERFEPPEHKGVLRSNGAFKGFVSSEERINALAMNLVAFLRPNRLLHVVRTAIAAALNLRIEIPRGEKGYRKSDGQYNWNKDQKPPRCDKRHQRKNYRQD